MRNNANIRNNNTEDNLVTLYLNYVTENQRLYRYIIENSDNNERFLTTLLNDRLLSHRIRSRTRSQNPTRNTPRNYYPRQNVDRSYLNRENNTNQSDNFIWSPGLQPNYMNSQPYSFPFTPSFNFLAPVNIRPTDEQINSATTVLPYNNLSEEVRETIGGYCIITAADLSGTNIMRINQCNHYFSEQGLRRHFETSVRCPICRFDIRESTQTQPNEPETPDISGNENGELDVSNNLITIRNEMLERLRGLFNIPVDSNSINSDMEFDVSNNNITLSYSFYTGMI